MKRFLSHFATNPFGWFARQLNCSASLVAVAWTCTSGLIAQSPELVDPEALPSLFQIMAGNTPAVEPILPFSAPARERLLRVNPNLADHAGQWLQPGRSVRLDLLENQDVTLRVTRVQRAKDGAIEVEGGLSNLPDSSAHLVLDRGELSGLALIPGLGVFQWVPHGAGTPVVARLPSGHSLQCATPDGPSIIASESISSPGSGVTRQALEVGRWDSSLEPLQIDVMVMYSPLALTAHGDEISLRQAIQEMLNSANRSFTNSLVGVRLNPVFIGLHNTWRESGNMLTDFDAMFADSRVTQWRNDYKADLVYLIIESDANGYGGAATLLSNPLGNPSRSMSIFRRTVMAGNPRWSEFESLGFTHETGHMLGAGHDREHGYPSAFQGAKAAFPYSNGYRFEVGGITYRTAMGYDPGVQLSLFSNPDLNFDGVPLGVAADQPGAADNARTLNLIAPKVAAYRIAHSRIGFAEPALSVGEQGGSVTVSLVRTGNLNTSTQVTVGFDATSPAKASLDYTRPASVSVAFATNQARAEIVIPILQDELLEGDEPLRLTLSSVQGNHGLGTNASLVITIRDDEPAYAVSPAVLALNEGGGEAEVTVEFTGTIESNASRELQLRIGLEGDSATVGSDYTVTPTTLSFTTENRRQSFRIRSLPDELAEPDETVRIGVGNAAVEVRFLDHQRAGSLSPIAKPNAQVIALRALPTGGVVLGGDFTSVDGSPLTAIARLRIDGTVDSTFTPPTLVTSPVKQAGVPTARVMCLTPLASGDWLVGGVIGLADGVPARNLVRLKRDGRLDPSFQHPGFDGAVAAVVEQPDGRLLIGGLFDHVGEKNIRGLVRLNADGTLDTTFKLEPGLGGTVVAGHAIGLLPDGRILVGGTIEKYNGTTVRNLVRLQADGSLDTSFPLLKSGASTPIDRVAVLPDGRAYVGGFFETIGGRPYRKLVRLTADGAVDTTFRAVQPNGEVLEIVPLPNGQLLVGGGFTVIAGVNRRFIALLNEDGTSDDSFDLGRGAGDHVWSLAAGGDGSLFVGGALRSFNDQPGTYLARVRLPKINGGLALSGTLENGSLRTRVLGFPGSTYEIEASPDLRTWQSEGQVRIDGLGDTAEFLEPIRESARFLRLKSP